MSEEELDRIISEVIAEYKASGTEHRTTLQKQANIALLNAMRNDGKGKVGLRNGASFKIIKHLVAAGVLDDSYYSDEGMLFFASKYSLDELTDLQIKLGIWNQ